MPHPVLDAAARYRAALLAQERQAATRLVQAYGRSYARLDAAVDALEQQVADKAGGMTEAEVARLASLRSLQQQVVEQVERFAVYADTEIANQVTATISAGLNDSRGLALAYFSPPTQRALLARWDMLPTETVETMLGFTAADSPLRATLVGRLGEAVGTRMADRLVDAIATGMNPRRIREFVRAEAGVGLTWALTTARTAQLWAYREATRANYVANRDIVSGWTWYAALDGRVCMSCVAQHGSRHAVDEVLNDHHNGRCVAIPTVPLAQRLGIAAPPITPGEQWFRALPQATQQQRMGGGMWDAWQAGEFDFGDISQPYKDDVYGDMLREASLVGLLGERAKEYYREPGR